MIGARQSLVTTFLFYQALAYLGSTVGDWLVGLGAGDAASRAGGRGLQAVIGGIVVEADHGGGVWSDVAEIYETGPLATDIHFVPLPDGVDGAHVRLRLPQGGWRLDYVALATLTGEVIPRRIAPSTIRGTLGAEFGANRTPATQFPIVTQPGDAYDFVYQVPPGAHDLYIDSHGYYLEWMRAEWMREEEPLAALRTVADPARTARDLAPAFKRLEPDAEILFWRSRYARP